MKNTVPILLAAAIGALGFHAYYLSLDRLDRCRWDNRIGVERSDACRLPPEPASYDRAGRAKLDALINDVAR